MRNLIAGLLMLLTPGHATAGERQVHEVSDLRIVVDPQVWRHCRERVAACYDRRTRTIYIQSLDLDDPVSLYWLGEEMAHHLGEQHK